MKILGPAAVAAFEKRGIGAETVVRMGVYSASRSGSSEVIADPVGNIVVFPFIEHGRVVNEKFRAPGKKFWQTSGGKKTFYNSDVLDDPNLATGAYALVITEGEIDCLTAIDCGFPLTVSVPEGAPPAANAERGSLDSAELPPIDPSGEPTGKFAFLWANRDRLKRIKRFVLAVDGDVPGQRLAAELVRRLSAARCSFVSYPSGCKDLNDVRTRLGPEAVTGVLNGAKPYPVRGLYKLADYPETKDIPTVSTGWWTLDRHLKIFSGEFGVISGIPGMGKSVWTFNLLSNLAALHCWPSAVFSPEMPAVPQCRNILRKIGRTISEIGNVDRFINEYFSFIDADPTGTGEEDVPFDLDWIIERATDAVLRDGARVLVIDPWNEVEHAKLKNESTADYIGRSIRSLKRFSRLYDVVTLVVAHPTKDIVGKDGKSRLPSLYDIADSAHWFNKCDHGIIIDRQDAHADVTSIHVKKVRFDGTGERGEVKLKYSRENCRYSLLQPAAEPELFT